jgi:hypothetical protein
MRDKLEKLLAILDTPGKIANFNSATGVGMGELGEFQVAEARDLVVQLIAMLDGPQAELKSKNTRRQ